MPQFLSGEQCHLSQVQDVVLFLHFFLLSVPVGARRLAVKDKFLKVSGLSFF